MSSAAERFIDIELPIVEKRRRRAAASKRLSDGADLYTKSVKASIWLAFAKVRRALKKSTAKSEAGLRRAATLGPEMLRKELEKVVLPALSKVGEAGFEHGQSRISRRSLGGPGSGNFGHKGRPGEVGGSASDAGDSLTETDEKGQRSWKKGSKFTGPVHPKFVKAAKFVTSEYSNLLDLVPAVHFVPNEGPKSKHGQFSTRTKEINIWQEPDNYGAPRYVETLVHELTHAKQQLEGRTYSEPEAREAGDKAKRAYISWQRARDRVRFASEFRHAAADGPFNKSVAIEFAKEHAFELIEDLTATTRDRLRDALVEGYKEEDFESIFEAILKAVGDESRAQAIAEHEVQLMAHEGQRTAWAQAQDEGLITSKQKKVWLTSDNPCEFCLELEGEEVELDEVYSDGSYGPPRHPRCKCSEELI